MVSTPWHSQPTPLCMLLSGALIVPSSGWVGSRFTTTCAAQEERQKNENGSTRQRAVSADTTPPRSFSFNGDGDLNGQDRWERKTEENVFPHALAPKYADRCLVSPTISTEKKKDIHRGTRKKRLLLRDSHRPFGSARLRCLHRLSRETQPLLAAPKRSLREGLRAHLGVAVAVFPTAVVVQEKLFQHQPSRHLVVSARAVLQTFNLFRSRRGAQ